MPSNRSNPRSARAFGPVQILDASLGRQLLGFVLAFVGFEMISWPADLRTPLTPTVLYTAIGAFIVFNGLYLGGVRFR